MRKLLTLQIIDIMLISNLYDRLSKEKNVDKLMITERLTSITEKSKKKA